VNAAQATFQALPSQAEICSTANPGIWRFLDPEDDVHDVRLTAVAVSRTAFVTKCYIHKCDFANNIARGGGLRPWVLGT